MFLSIGMQIVYDVAACQNENTFFSYVQLIEGRSRYLPVGFLVEIANCYCVGQELIELLGHFQPYWFLQFKCQDQIHRPVLLNLCCALMQTRLGADLSEKREFSLDFIWNLLFWECDASCHS
jgi:hypothetical protein